MPLKNAQMADEDQVNIEFFNAIDGLDEDILDIVNQRLASTKEFCEKRLIEHIRYEDELLKKINAMNVLAPNAYSIVNLSLSDIMKSLQQIYPETQTIWEAIHEHYGQDCFLVIIEREYGSRFAKDYTFLNQQIDKVNEEAQFQIKEL